jgi:hypothetical protein
MNLTVPQLMKTKDHQLSNQSMNLRTSPRFQSELLRYEWNKDSQQSWLNLKKCRHELLKCKQNEDGQNSAIYRFKKKIPPHSAMNEKKTQKTEICSYKHGYKNCMLGLWACCQLSCFMHDICDKYNTWSNKRQYYRVSRCLSWFP